MTTQLSAEEQVHSMLNHDPFSQWLGLKITSIEPGAVSATMKVRKDMLNGFDVCHGGVTFSFADSVLAFASNTYGRISVSIEASMTYPNPIYEGDELFAVAQELSRTKKIGCYDVKIRKKDNTLVGDFRGIVYITEKKRKKE